jgi:hypothetical protein
MITTTISISLTTQTCYCGIPYAAPSTLYDHIAEAGGELYCPVGHVNHIARPSAGLPAPLSRGTWGEWVKAAATPEVEPEVEPMLRRLDPSTLQGQAYAALCSSPGQTGTDLAVLMPEARAGSLSSTLSVLFKRGYLTRTGWPYSYSPSDTAVAL